MNTYGYVGGNVLGAVDPLGLLQEAVKKCGCASMKANNYESAMAWYSALSLRKKTIGIIQLYDHVKIIYMHLLV